jgi:ferredoxin--NADP+ reductase
MKYKIIEKKELALKIKMLKITAPEIANKAKAGQFIIIRVDKKGERIPLTITDWDTKNGTITIIFLEVGVSTHKLATLEVGDYILDISGPMGNPSDIKQYGLAAVVCGGVGTAAAYPIAKALKEAGNHVVAIIGARTESLLVLEEKMRQASDELYVSTDDGSKGSKGFVSDVLNSLIQKGNRFDVTFAIGPPMMMRATVNVTKSYNLKSVVSLNPIMVDGCGMCGACRVTIGGKNKFACVDGPEFDGDLVNFDEVIKRLKAFQLKEQHALEEFHKMNQAKVVV